MKKLKKKINKAKQTIWTKLAEVGRITRESEGMPSLVILAVIVVNLLGENEQK